MTKVPFHQYPEMPRPHSNMQVPRISEEEARSLAHGKRVVNEIAMTSPGVEYSVREYQNYETGESVFLGGDFTSWA